MISTVEQTDKPEDKREKLKKLREYHQENLDTLGVPNGVFIPKMAYRPYGKTELYIAFFQSEISKGEDVYVEFTSKELVPEDQERKLYKWKFNPHFEEEYEKTEPNATTGHCRYLVPVEELAIMKAPEKPKEKEKIKTIDKQPEVEFELANPDNDLPLDQITIRDLAAILLKIPVSHKKWLNEIITKNQ